MLTGGLFLSLVTSWFPLHTPSGKIPFAALILSVQLHSELTPRVCPQGRWPCSHCSPFSSPWSGPGTPFQVGCPARAVPFNDLEVLTLGPSSGASAPMALTTLCGHALSIPGPRQCPLAPTDPVLHCESLSRWVGDGGEGSSGQNWDLSPAIGWHTSTLGSSPSCCCFFPSSSAPPSLAPLLQSP